MSTTTRELASYDQTVQGFDEALKSYSKQSIEIMKLIVQMKNFVRSEKNEVKLKSLSEQIEHFMHNAGQLHQHLDKNEFEVAIMGKEKAGKSSLLNGLLNLPMLPNQAERCTYTTMAIRWSELNDQRIRIEYLTRDEFNAHKDEISSKMSSHPDYKASLPTPEEMPSSEPDVVTEPAAAAQPKEAQATHESFNNLKTEYQEMEDCLKEFSGLIGRSPLEQKYRDAHELKLILKENVASKSARTVKNITLWTNSLPFKNIVIYDVPGFDSPTIIHKKQTKEKAAIADSIIFVKRFQSPSLTEVDVNMMEIFEHNDFIPIREKLIVALTFPHEMKSAEGYATTFQTIKRIWSEKHILESALVPVDAYLHANIDNSAKEIVRTILDKMNIDDGVENLRRAIEDKIFRTRAQYLQQKFQGLEIKFKGLVNQFLEVGAEELPLQEDEAESKTRVIKTQIDMRMKWWKKEWRKIKSEFGIFLGEKLRKNQHLITYRQSYVSMIKTLPEEIGSASRAEQQRIFDREGAFEAEGRTIISEGHAAIRRTLNAEVYHKLTNHISKRLGEIIWQTITEIVEWIYERMWYILPVKEKLLCDQVLNSKILLQKKTETLLLNSARPAIELFLRHSRHDSRINTVHLYNKTVRLLEIFYRKEGSDGERDHADLKGNLTSFLITGGWKHDLDPRDKTKLVPLRGALNQTFHDVNEEVTQDFNEFLDYMCNSIYYAAGLEDFFSQEIENIRKVFNFEDEENNQWGSYFLQAIEDKNDKIPYHEFELDEALKSEITGKLRQIQETFSDRSSLESTLTG